MDGNLLPPENICQHTVYEKKIIIESQAWVAASPETTLIKKQHGGIQFTKKMLSILSLLQNLRSSDCYEKNVHK